jgi:hypothetical protein
MMVSLSSIIQIFISSWLPFSLIIIIVIKCINGFMPIWYLHEVEFLIKQYFTQKQMINTCVFISITNIMTHI